MALNSDIQQIIVFVPTIPWKTPLFQRPNQLAKAFARRNCLVFFFEPSYATDFSAGIQQVAERLYIVGHNTPWKSFQSLRSPVVFTLAYNAQYLEHFNQPFTVYEYIDELDVFPGNLEDYQKVHEQMIRSADLVIATADTLQKKVEPVRGDVLFCPNGTDYDFIQSTIQETITPPQDFGEIIALQKPIIGYYGAMAKWLDFDLLKSVATQRPGYQFVLIGPKYDVDRSIEEAHLDEVTNISWLGARLYQELPRYLKYFDVATIPFKVNDVTHSTSPIKLFEYMTAGKPIVTTAMQECQKYPVVLIADNPTDFAQKLDQALELGHDQHYMQTLDQIARQNSWDVRVQEILDRFPPSLH